MISQTRLDNPETHFCLVSRYSLDTLFYTKLKKELNDNVRQVLQGFLLSNVLLRKMANGTKIKFVLGKTCNSRLKIVLKMSTL